MHAFGVWEEAGAHGENLRRQKENMQTPHRTCEAVLQTVGPCSGPVYTKYHY